jgi:hypothetical protein
MRKSCGSRRQDRNDLPGIQPVTHNVAACGFGCSWSAAPAIALARPVPRAASPSLPSLPGGAGGPARDAVGDVHYRLEVRLTPADVGQRVVIRWRRPAPGGGAVVADVLGILEEADAGSFTVRTRDGKLVVIPAGRALAGKIVPPPPARRRSAGPASR